MLAGYYATAATVTLKTVYAVSPRASFIPGSDTQPSEKSSLKSVCREVNLMHTHPPQTQKLRTQQFHSED